MLSPINETGFKGATGNSSGTKSNKETQASSETKDQVCGEPLPTLQMLSIQDDKGNTDLLMSDTKDKRGTIVLTSQETPAANQNPAGSVMIATHANDG